MTDKPKSSRPPAGGRRSLAEKLSQLGYIELFHRLTTSSLDSVWDMKGSRATLEKIATDKTLPRLANFLAAEVLFAKLPDYPGPQDVKYLAKVYATALAENFTRITNAWGQPGELDGPAGQHMVALGKAIVPELVKLLDDENTRAYSGSREASYGNSYQYRVKDFAAFFISHVLDLPFEVNKSPNKRDREIEKLKKLLSKGS